MTATIIPRESWGARPPRHRYRIPTPTPKLYLHHSAGSGADEATVRAIQAFHMAPPPAGRGWSDIAYSFLIDNDAPDVDIFEGRGPGIAGGHTAGQNTVSHGLCIIGDFTHRAPWPQTLEAVAVLVALGHVADWWPDRITGGHRDAPDAATSCPGDALWNAIPHINARTRQLLETPMEIIAGFKFEDAATWPAWARDSIRKTIEAGIIRGKEIDRRDPSRRIFAPADPLTRAEAAVLLDRIGHV